MAVVLARQDDFCPEPATSTLYEKLGCRVRLVDDNHVLCTRAAREAMLAGLDEVLT